jgi:hypothetical protein
MPYIGCPRCDLRAYTAAAYSGVDSCSRCMALLPHRRAAGREGLQLHYALKALEELMRHNNGRARSRDG